MATFLQDIITITRQRSGMENNYAVSDIELSGYINNSLAELDDILVTDYEDYRLATFQSVLPADGQSNQIPIPSNLYKLRGVDYLVNGAGSRWITLFPFQLPDRNKDTGIQVRTYRNNLSYRLGDASIIIMPQVQAGGTFQVWYTPKFVPLATLSDALNIQMDTQSWVEYAVVDCCIKIFNKQNLDPSAFMQEKMLLQARVRAAAKNRDSAGPKSVANVRFQNDDCGVFGWDKF